MNIKEIESFDVIGISVRTKNHQDHTMQDIGNLWSTFLKEDIGSQIPNKVHSAIYAVYTHYDGDFNDPYTMILGHRVDKLDDIPEGMTGISICKGNYIPVLAKGNLHDGIVLKAWQKVWQANYPRVYTADFEVYGPRASDPHNAEVDIYIAIE